MKIQITQQDIDNGRKDHAFGCAIALGLNQEFACNISVSGWICIGKDYYQAMPEVRQWIADFDRGKPVKPIVIELVQTYIPKEDHPTIFVHTSNRLDTRKARKTPAPPDLQVCGIARIAWTPKGVEGLIRF